MRLHFMIFVSQKRKITDWTSKTKHFHHYVTVSHRGKYSYHFSGRVASRSLFPCMLCLYTSVFMWRGDGASAAGASWFLSCPPLHSMRQCFGPGPRTKPEARCSAPASPERRLSLTLHQLGRHSRLCVCVCAGV